MNGFGAPLVLSSYSLGTTVDFAERVRVAAAAGFDGIGLRAENCWAALDAGLSLADMTDIAAAARVPVLEVEYVTGWGSPDSEQQGKERFVFAMAHAFGVGHVNAGLLEQLPTAEIVTAFGDLCDRAGDLVVALEFMPYSGVPTLRSAAEIISGAPNGAILFDLWHWARGAHTLADLDAVPAESIVSLQLDDVRAVPMTPLRAESLGHRLLPGEGDGDVVAVLKALRAKGIRPRVVGVEVISDQLVAAGVEQAARRCAETSRAVLDAVG